MKTASTCRRHSTGGWETRAARGKATRWSSTRTTLMMRPGLTGLAISIATLCTLVERYTLADMDHLNYTATIEDSKVFTRPWKMNLIFYRHKEPNFQLLEYECQAFLLDDVPLIPTKK